MFFDAATAGEVPDSCESESDFRRFFSGKWRIRLRIETNALRSTEKRIPKGNIQPKQDCKEFRRSCPLKKYNQNQI
ncbi:hypothetical protein CH380_14605 [Leptospira adleri]|uniref:Uncharacterized protein n=1 Tax=Leptospira adleri TaxID=2023186 RepID=A0A2M9YLT9_9LEPT|nr:hypothetical protein CH380_14605 [Leptospira adleri]PJZ60144.1 hypothetical protein CH376_19895 [Leptospira adleri]